jgi:hypothetical protein
MAYFNPGYGGKNDEIQLRFMRLGMAEGRQNKLLER